MLTRPKTGIPGALLIVLASVLAPPSDAAIYNSLDFFETQVAGACIAENLANRGSYLRQYKGPSGECPGLTTYHIVHGANTHPWSTESFYAYQGYLWQSIELFSHESSGDITSYRAFRNHNNYWKGIPVLPLSFNNSKFTWYPSYVEEYWTDWSGDPVCYNTQQTEVDGSVNWGHVYYAGTYSNWLQDKRSNSLNPNVWHPLDVIVRVDQWGSNHYEYYHYARWQNPATGAWQGIGLVKWEHWIGSTRVGLGESHYLVDCDVSIECTTCPP